MVAFIFNKENTLHPTYAFIPLLSVRQDYG